MKTGQDKPPLSERMLQADKQKQTLKEGLTASASKSLKPDTELTLKDVRDTIVNVTRDLQFILGLDLDEEQIKTQAKIQELSDQLTTLQKQLQLNQKASSDWQKKAMNSILHLERQNANIKLWVMGMAAIGVFTTSLVIWTSVPTPRETQIVDQISTSTEGMPDLERIKMPHPLIVTSLPNRMIFTCNLNQQSILSGCKIVEY